MKFIINIFWNQKENRLRAGYRIILTLIIFRIVWKGLGFLFESIPGIPTEITSETSFWYFLISATTRLLRVLISVWLASRFLDRRVFSDFGIRLNKEWWKNLGFGMGLGMLLMGSIFLIEFFAGWLTISETFHTAQSGQPFILSILVFIILFVCVGFSEELFYRGYFLTNLAEGFNFKNLGSKYSIVIAASLSSLLFGAFHLGSPNASIVSTINIILWGVLFCVPYILTGSLAIPIGIHITWNLFQGNVFGFPVSGSTFSLETVTFFSIKQGGPELWTGGAFGPEGGLLTLLALIVGLFIILGWIRIRQGNIKILTAIAESPKIEKKYN